MLRSSSLLTCATAASVIGSNAASSLPSLSSLQQQLDAEKSKPRVGVSIVVHLPAAYCVSAHADKFLMVIRSKAPNKGMWSCPGGSLHRGETTLEAAKRELLEETSLDAAVNSSSKQQQQQQQPDVVFFEESHRVIDCLPASCSSSSSSLAPHFVLIQHGAVVQSAEAARGVKALDDAAGIAWMTKSELREMEENGKVVPGTMDSILAFERSATKST